MIRWDLLLLLEMPQLPICCLFLECAFVFVQHWRNSWPMRLRGAGCWWFLFPRALIFLTMQQHGWVFLVHVAQNVWLLFTHRHACSWVAKKLWNTVPCGNSKRWKQKSIFLNTIVHFAYPILRFMHMPTRQVHSNGMVQRSWSSTDEVAGLFGTTCGATLALLPLPATFN